MLDKVRRFIKRERLLEPGQPVRVAVSGGIDSMVLLHLLRELGHPCHVAHVNHGLRGAESDGDEVFVREHCVFLRVPFVSRTMDVVKHRQERGGSVQMAARDLRQAWFAELWKEDPMPIALAHHKDDAVETLFIDLLRGAGMHGWGSMAPVTGVYVRPLLGVDRTEITEYASVRGIPYREDSSNADPKYLRNRIRHELIPLLEDLRPGALATIARSLGILRELEEAGQQMSIAELAGVRPSEGKVIVPMSTFNDSPVPGLLLHRLLRHLGFHPDVLDRIRDAILERSVGAVFNAVEWQVTVDREALVLGPAQHELPVHIIDPLLPMTGPDGFHWALEDGGVDQAPKSKREAWLDADRLSFPLELRPWRHGDRMRPIGLSGSKLISDILTDAKVPTHARDRAYVLESRGEIAWLVGHRLGEGFQATAESRRVLHCTWTGH